MRVFILFILLLIPARSMAKMEPVQNIPMQVERIEKYLNGLKTAQARFVPTTHDGTQLTGTVYLDRPGKLRFEYDPPLEDFVVADGFFIYFYDAELGEQTNAPIGETLADFLLRSDIKMSGDVKVDHIKRGGGYLQVGLTQAADAEAGSLMLALTEDDDKGLSLKKWRIIDGQGLLTEIELFYLKSGVEHPDGLFVYKDPKGRSGYNR